MSLPRVEDEHVRCTVEQEGLSETVSGIERHPLCGWIVCVPASAVLSLGGGEASTQIPGIQSPRPPQRAKASISIGPIVIGPCRSWAGEGLTTWGQSQFETRQKSRFRQAWLSSRIRDARPVEARHI